MVDMIQLELVPCGERMMNDRLLYLVVACLYKGSGALE